MRCATVAVKETDPDYVPPTGKTDKDVAFSTMETLFLYMLNELEPHLKILLTHTFASHTMRTLLLVLSGKPIASATTLIHSKKKENISLGELSLEETSEGQVVPQSFREAAQKIVAATSGAFGIEELHAMAVHQTGSPTLQILIQIEMGLSKKERRAKEASGAPSLLQTLTGISNESKDSKGDQAENNSSRFFQNLLYDPVGSHLAESMMQYAPTRKFKQLYTEYFKQRMGSLARNETAAFVVQRVLERLDKQELEEAITDIVPQIKSLIDRSRVAVIKTLIDCCAKNSVKNIAEIKTAIESAYAEGSQTELVLRMLKISHESLKPNTQVSSNIKKDPAHLHGSLLAQSMLDLPGEFNSFIVDR